jgi:hypothetical protein
MPVLEVCKWHLKDGIIYLDPALLKVFPEFRSKTKIDFVFYSSIESPTDFFILGLWPSKAAHDEYVVSPEAPAVFAALEKLSNFEWVEVAEFDNIKSLSIEAPVMTVARAFVKGATIQKSTTGKSATPKIWLGQR